MAILDKGLQNWSKLWKETSSFNQSRLLHVYDWENYFVVIGWEQANLLLILYSSAN